MQPVLSRRSTQVRSPARRRSERCRHRRRSAQSTVEAAGTSRGRVKCDMAEERTASALRENINRSVALDGVNGSEQGRRRRRLRRPGSAP